MNAPKAVENDSVLVRIEVVRPRKAQAPTGNGFNTSPATVERNMARSCQACIDTCTGFGTKNRTIKPMDIEIIKGISLAPLGDSSTGGGGGEGDAWIGWRKVRGFGDGFDLKRARGGRRREGGDRRLESGRGEAEEGKMEGGALREGGDLRSKERREEGEKEEDEV